MGQDVQGATRAACVKFTVLKVTDATPQRVVASNLYLGGSVAL